MQELDFHEVADEFVNLANDMSNEWAPNFISAAILYAAARYNAFHLWKPMATQKKKRPLWIITPNNIGGC